MNGHASITIYWNDIERETLNKTFWNISFEEFKTEMILINKEHSQIPLSSLLEEILDRKESVMEIEYWQEVKSSELYGGHYRMILHYNYYFNEDLVERLVRLDSK